MPRHPDNRLLTIALPGYRISETDLEGEAAPITHVATYEHVPCGTEEAVCQVTDNLGRVFVARTGLVVAGCF